MFGLTLYKVRGASMAPTLQDGDIVLLRQGKQALTGSIIVTNHPRLGKIIKRVNQSGHLEGDGPDSTCAEDLGAVEKTNVIGRAVLAVTPRGLRRL